MYKAIFSFSNVVADGFSLAQNGAIMLTHELNNFTMQEAITFYPQLKAAFAVRRVPKLLNHAVNLTILFSCSTSFPSA
jgi:hypothetical protein